MSIELFELQKLEGEIIALIIPGYLWSFMFTKRLTKAEHFVFGFNVTIRALTAGAFIIEFIIGQPVTKNLILENNCTNTRFLQKYKICVIYHESCTNTNLTKLTTNIYLYPNLTP